MTMHRDVLVIESHEAGALKEPFHKAGGERTEGEQVPTKENAEKETLQILRVNSERRVHR